MRNKFLLHIIVMLTILFSFSASAEDIYLVNGKHCDLTKDKSIDGAFERLSQLWGNQLEIVFPPTTLTNGVRYFLVGAKYKDGKLPFYVTDSLIWCNTLADRIASVGTPVDRSEEAETLLKRGDYAEALRIFRTLAVQGDENAQYRLGTIYHEGKGIPQDYEEAVKWYRLAAARGHGNAQFVLGTMYAQGHGVQIDTVRAHMWFILVAVGGDPTAVMMRDASMKGMTTQQVAQAQRMARNCQQRKFSGCD